MQAMDGTMNLEESLEERLKVINCKPKCVAWRLRAQGARVLCLLHPAIAKQGKAPCALDRQRRRKMAVPLHA